jgi:hypothetical protein
MRLIFLLSAGVAGWAALIFLIGMLWKRLGA